MDHVIQGLAPNTHNQKHTATTPRRETTMQGQWNLWGPVNNIVGVFRGSALSATLFVIYLDDMTQDHQSLNDSMHLPRRYCIQPREEIHTQQLIQYIARTTKPETTTQPEKPATETTMQEPQTQETLERADAYVYADDTNLVAEQDTAPQIAQKLENYSTVTESRHVGINWGKVEIIARKKEHATPKAGLPHPFNKAMTKTPGKALGKIIDVNLTNGKAIKARIHKARQSWQLLRKKLFANKTLKIRTKTLLWNAIVRSTLTYGIQTLDLTEQDKKGLGGFTFYCLRQIQDIHWANKSRKPQSEPTHRTWATHDNVMDKQVKTQTCPDAN